jgi:hypothetical protein
MTAIEKNYPGTPAWLRDAKFGIWAHWGPQCQPEAGDWYARGIYEEGSGQYKSHITKYCPLLALDVSEIPRSQRCFDS